jgi:hypothetical protein
MNKSYFCDFLIATKSKLAAMFSWFKLKEESIDAWLLRLSHFSQLLLVIAAFFTYFYEVRPAFELSEVKKDLAVTKAALESTKGLSVRYYIDLRKRIITNFNLKSFAYCGGPFIYPYYSDQKHFTGTLADQNNVLSLDVPKCLEKRLLEDPELKNLTKENMLQLKDEVMKVSLTLIELHRDTLREFNEIKKKSTSKSDDDLAQELHSIVLTYMSEINSKIFLTNDIGWINPIP